MCLLRNIFRRQFFSIKEFEAMNCEFRGGPHLNKMKTCLGADLDFFKIPQATFVKVPVIFASARGLALLICSGFGFTLPYKCNQVARRGILQGRLPSAFYIYKIKWEKRNPLQKKKKKSAKIRKK